MELKGAVAASVAALCLSAAPARAQIVDASPDPAKVRVRIGPLWMNPSISLSNVGVDNNVFNDAVNPKSDFTLTATPTANFWLHVSDSWVTAQIDDSISYYQRYASERSTTTKYRVAWTVPLSRVAFRLGAGFSTIRDRPGFEIDTRARRRQPEYDAAVEVRGLPSTFFGVTAHRERTDFDPGQVFLGNDLQQQLNRTSTTLGVAVRHLITPLTSVTIGATRTDDRFEFEPLRNAVATNATVSATFDPAAQINGSMSVGFSDFVPTDPNLPRYQGTVAAVNVTYTLFGTTRLGFNANRDVQYSYDVLQPYYVASGVGGSVSQQIFGPVDVVVRASIQDLAYRDRLGAAIAVANRTDTVQTFGGGFGYHLGDNVRLGVNADKANRHSLVAFREYDGWKIGSSLTYGF